MSKCLPGEHYWAWDAGDCGPPPASLRCLCGLMVFGEHSEVRVPEYLRRWDTWQPGDPAPPAPDNVVVLFDGRCERCRCPIDDHRFGMCPRFDYSRPAP
jgi:hypothetical protein